MPDPITFCEFMRSALYDEKRGYYMTDRAHFGRDGDFNTTSQYHELFGQIMAREFTDLFRALDCPAPFTIVELGPGSGDFARQVLAEIRMHDPAAFQSLRYLCCEISPSLLKRQRTLLDEFSDQVSWISGLNEITDPVTGLFFSNEFFDALPVHVIRQQGSKLAEVYVAQSTTGELFLREDELSSSRLADCWDRVGVLLADGQLAEISLETIDWLRTIADKLEVGRVVTIDYGDIATGLYTSARPEGTLRCFSRHRLSETPLEDIGEKDLTASVNFSALIEYGHDFGLEHVSIENQPEYLVRRGLLERAAELARSAGQEAPDALAHRLGLKQLFVPHGITAHFKVLVQEKKKRG